MIAPSPTISTNTTAASSSSSRSRSSFSSTSIAPPCHRYSNEEALRRTKASEAAASMMTMMRPMSMPMSMHMSMHMRMQMSMYSSNKRDFMPPLPSSSSSYGPSSYSPHLYHPNNTVNSSQMYYDDQIRHAKRRRLLLSSPSSMMTSMAISAATAAAAAGAAAQEEESNQRMMFSPPQNQRNLQRPPHKKRKPKKRVSFAPPLPSVSASTSSSSSTSSTSTSSSATVSTSSPSPSPTQQLLEEVRSYEITKDDVNNAWYSPQQYKEFISDCRSILETVRSSSSRLHDTTNGDGSTEEEHVDDMTTTTTTTTTTEVVNVDESSCTRGLEDQLAIQTQRMKLKRRRYLIKTVVEQYAFCKKEWEQRTTSSVGVGGSDDEGSDSNKRTLDEEVDNDFCPKAMISSWIRDVSLKLSVHSTLQAKKLGDSDEKFVSASQL